VSASACGDNAEGAETQRSRSRKDEKSLRSLRPLRALTQPRTTQKAPHGRGLCTSYDSRDTAARGLPSALLGLLLADLLVHLGHVQLAPLPITSSSWAAESMPGWANRITCSRKIIRVGMERIWKWAARACSSSVLTLANTTSGWFSEAASKMGAKARQGAPGRPEVQDDDVVAGDGGLEVPLGEFDDGHDGFRKIGVGRVRRVSERTYTLPAAGTGVSTKTPVRAGFRNG